MFPSNDKSLGEFISIPRKLIWKRIPDIVDNPCIYNTKNHPAESILTVSSGESYLNSVLVALALRPERIFGIFNHQREANIYGAYNIRVKIKGVLQWMVIDDYVPVFEDS